MSFTMERRFRVREKPRMSAPKLGEYMSSARAARRERIIHDQKFVSDYMVVRYAHAENAIRVALLSGEVEKRVLDGARTISARAVRTSFQDDARRNCIEALESFGRIWPALDLSSTIATTTGQSSFSLTIEKVIVSARPLVLLSRTGRRGSIERGALQIVLRKEAALDDRGGEAVAQVLRDALVASRQTHVSPELCVVVDVFAGKVFRAPVRATRLSDEIRSACREIAVRWPAVAA